MNGTAIRAIFYIYRDLPRVLALNRPLFLGVATMTSRERVLTALEHKEADRVPIDLGSSTCCGITGIAYNRLKRYLGIRSGRTRIFDVMQQLAEVEPEILSLFACDVLPLERLRVRFGIPNRNWKPWTLPDGTPCEVPGGFDPRLESDGSLVIERDNRVIARMPTKGFYFDTMDEPREMRGIEEYSWGIVDDEELEYLSRTAERLYHDTDFAIVSGSWGGLFWGGIGLRGFANFVSDLILNKNWVSDLLDKMTENIISNLDRLIDAVGDHVQIIKFADDFGSQQGPFISPALFDEFFLPRYKKIFQHIKAKGNYYIFLHTCGSVSALLDSMIQAGVDILNPVQTSAADMDPRMLKERFGDRITFWGGGCDTQAILPRSSPAIIREHVKERIGIFGRGGGFVFNPVHNIQADVPPENIVAMYEAAREFGVYPLRS